MVYFFKSHIKCFKVILTLSIIIITILNIFCDNHIVNVLLMILVIFLSIVLFALMNERGGIYFFFIGMSFLVASFVMGARGYYVNMIIIVLNSYVIGYGINITSVNIRDIRNVKKRLHEEPYYYIDPRWKKSSDENFDSLRIILSLYNSEDEDGVSESKKATKLLMSVNKYELICMKNYLKKGLGQTEEDTIKKVEPYIAVLSLIVGTFYELGLFNDVYTYFPNILPKQQIENITHLIILVGVFFLVLICFYIYKKDTYNSKRREVLQWSLSAVENALEMKKSD